MSSSIKLCIKKATNMNSSEGNLSDNNLSRSHSHNVSNGLTRSSINMKDNASRSKDLCNQYLQGNYNRRASKSNSSNNNTTLTPVVAQVLLYSTSPSVTQASTSHLVQTTKPQKAQSHQRNTNAHLMKHKRGPNSNKEQLLSRKSLEQVAENEKKLMQHCCD